MKKPYISYVVLEILSQENATIMLLLSSYFLCSNISIREKCWKKRKKTCCYKQLTLLFPVTTAFLYLVAYVYPI